MVEEEGQKQWGQLPEAIELISSCGCAFERRLASPFGFVFSQHIFRRAKSKHHHLCSLIKFKFQIYICLHGPFHLSSLLLFEQSPFLSFCAGIKNHAVLLKEGENCQHRNKTGNLSIKRAKDRWCVTRYSVSELCSPHSTRWQGWCRGSWAWREADLFFSRACADGALERLLHWWDIVNGHAWAGIRLAMHIQPEHSWPGIWAGTLSPSEVSLQSDKIFTGWSAQQLTTILRPNSVYQRGST